jgi:hypothetical protein
VTGKRRDCEVLITIYDARPVAMTVSCATRAPGAAEAP